MSFLLSKVNGRYQYALNLRLGQMETAGILLDSLAGSMIAQNIRVKNAKGIEAVCDRQPDRQKHGDGRAGKKDSALRSVRPRMPDVVTGDGFSQNRYGSGIRHHQTQDAPENRGFSGTGRTGQGHLVPVMHAQGQVFQHGLPVKGQADDSVLSPMPWPGPCSNAPLYKAFHAPDKNMAIGMCFIMPGYLAGG
jgi:hypothetical protein